MARRRATPATPRLVNPFERAPHVHGKTPADDEEKGLADREAEPVIRDDLVFHLEMGGNLIANRWSNPLLRHTSHLPIFLVKKLIIFR